MTEEFFNFNDFQTGFRENSREEERLLRDLERTFSRLEQLLSRRGRLPGMASGRISRRVSRGRLIIDSFSRAFGLFSGRGQPRTGPVFNPGGGGWNEDYEEKNARFPSSYGQILTDLFGSLQQFGNRNL